MEQKWFGANVKYFMGVVEEIDDSKAKDNLKLGRVRVRLLGVHSEQLVENDTTGEGIPVDSLHWAYLINSTTSASMNGIGTSPTGLLKGSWVLCISMDGNAVQDLYILGSLGGVPKNAPKPSVGFNDPDGTYPLSSHLNEPDTNRLARNEQIENTIVQEKRLGRELEIPVALTYNTWSEPLIPYETIYPYNYVYESLFKDDDVIESMNTGDVNLDDGLFEQITDVPKPNGHIFEFDSTPNGERVHLYHKTGTFWEIDKDGNKSEKIVKDKYEVVAGHESVLIKGNTTVTVKGHSTVLIVGDCTLEVQGNKRTLVHGDEYIEVKGDRRTLIHGNDLGHIKLDNNVKVEGTVNRDYLKGSNVKIAQDKNEKIVGNLVLKYLRGDFAPNGDILSDYTIADLETIEPAPPEAAIVQAV